MFFVFYLNDNHRCVSDREPHEHVLVLCFQCETRGNQRVPCKSGHFLRDCDSVELGGRTAL